MGWKIGAIKRKKKLKNSAIKSEWLLKQIHDWNLYLLSKEIREKAVFVIAKSYCPYSKKAKETLKKYNIKPEKIAIWDIDQFPDCYDIQV